MKKLIAFILAMSLVLALSFAVVIAVDNPDQLKTEMMISPDDPDPDFWTPPTEEV